MISKVRNILLQVLASDPSLSVTMLGVTKVEEHCTNGIKLNAALENNVNFTCLEARHLEPEVSKLLSSKFCHYTISHR